MSNLRTYCGGCQQFTLDPEDEDIITDVLENGTHILECPRCGSDNSMSREYLIRLRKEVKAVGNAWEGGKRKVVAVDLDKTLTKEGRWFVEDEEIVPDEETIEKVMNQVYKQGHVLIIWTARPWNVAEETVAWLRKHSVRFHGLQMEKGSADVYIDDKALNVEDFREEGL